MQRITPEEYFFHGHSYGLICWTLKTYGVEQFAQDIKEECRRDGKFMSINDIREHLQNLCEEIISDMREAKQI